VRFLEDLAGESPEPPSSVASSQRTELTLEEALRIALRENPDVRGAEARIAAARAGLHAARAGDLPSVTVDLGYLRADAPSIYLFKTIDAGRYRPGTDFNAPGSFENWEAGLGLGWNLYNGGRDQLAQEIARGGLAVEEQRRLVVENALCGAVIETWYGAHSAAERSAAARDSVNTVGAQLEEARARFEEGRALESDVFSLEVRRAEAREQQLRAEHGHQLALATLAQLIGQGGVVEIAPDAPALGLAESPESLAAALERAYASRPELEAARADVLVAERRLELARSAILPRADLFGRGWRDGPNPDFDESRDNWAFGLNLSWSLFDGGRRGAGEERARAELDQLWRVARRAELAVELDVRSAWLRLAEVRARVEGSSAAVRHAQDGLRLVEAQYRAGAAPITRYLEAELMHTEARMRHTNATFDIESARADLARAIGVLGAQGAGLEGQTR
jgi:outer membrane protein TolC